MRKLLITAILPVACILSNPTMATPHRVSDSAKITHVIDGNINEWKIEKFETDKETEVLYSIDHDASNLYLAMKITNQGLQMKMMMNGMSLFLDKKGKKKEGTGIEFPVKREGGGRDFSGGGGRGARGGGGAPGAERPDPKQMRENLAATMILLKTFGFDDQEDKTQLISTPNGVSVAFDWDEANNFYMEYSVPIGFLGSAASLNGKPLGIGWKINGMAAVTTTTELVAVPGGSTGGRGGGGGGRGGGSGGGANRNAAQDFGNASDSRFKEQSIWTKYVLNF